MAVFLSTISSYFPCAEKIISTITFDALKFAEHLEKTGLTREQAIAFTEAQKDAFSEVLTNNVAKQYF